MPDSRAQVRLAYSIVGGQAKGDKSWAREVIDKMHGKKMSSLPERVQTPARKTLSKLK